MATATSVLVGRRDPAHCRHRRDRHDRSQARSRPPSARALGPSFPSICGARHATWTRSWRSRGGAISLSSRTHARASAAATKGRKLGSIGHLGAFSFNYYKNMTCGEGGGVAVNDDALAERARCAIDPCHFYWLGRDEAVKPFSSNGARASELMGAMLNVQLDRLERMIGAMRAEKEADPGGDPLSRQSRFEADADEQRGSRLRDAGHVYSCRRRRRPSASLTLSERDRRQDRSPQLRRMGPGADGRRGRASGDESIQHAGQRRVPEEPIPRTCARSRSIFSIAR